MAESMRVLFADHPILSSVFVPWAAAVWAFVHHEWWRLAAIVAYVEIIGGPLILLK